MVGVQRKPIWRHTRRSRTKFMWSWVKNPTVVNRLVFLLFSRAFELSPRNPPRWGAVRLISAKLVVLGLSSESRLFMKSCWTLLRCTVSFLGNETRENPWFSKKYYANMQCSASKSETMQGTRSAMMHLCLFFFLRSCICVFWIDTRPLVTCTPSGTSEMAESMRRSFPCLKFWTWSSLLTNVHSSFLASDNDLHHEA
jgi:hypothetical protein